MDRILKFVKPLAGIIMLGVIIYFFPEMVLYFVIATVFSLLGRPLVERIKRVRIKKLKVNDSVAAVLTMAAMLSVIVLFFFIFAPLINRQAAYFARIDTKAILAYFQEPITRTADFLRRTNIVSGKEHLSELINAELNKLVSWTNVGNLFGTIVSTASSLLIGFFSVVFLTFFLLRDRNIIHNIFIAVTPEQFESKMNTVLVDTRVMLTRYFFGLLIELLCMMLLITLGLTAFGIENALMIGFLGGLMNIIPYVGPLLGGAIGTVLGVISVLASGDYAQLLPDVLYIIGVFAVSNAIDNFVLQPLIYSKSVNAHPIEIFLVILMAGKIGGIFGMVVAIPVYTVVRIVAKQFLTHFKFVRMLTKDMEFGGQDPNDASMSNKL